MTKLLQLFMLFFYYSIANKLPSRSTFRAGVLLRYFAVRHIFKHAGRNVNIAAGVRFGRGNLVSIGNNSGLGEDSYLVAMDEITIGDDVMVAPEVMILTGGHCFDNPDILFRKQKKVIAPVKIGNNCWIGARAILLPGVEIADGVVIGAGSVVTKSLLEPGVYAGNPAKMIRSLSI